jgi:hypothetical protein
LGGPHPKFCFLRPHISALLPRRDFDARRSRVNAIKSHTLTVMSAANKIDDEIDKYEKKEQQYVIFLRIPALSLWCLMV